MTPSYSPEMVRQYMAEAKDFASKFPSASPKTRAAIELIEASFTPEKLASFGSGAVEGSNYHKFQFAAKTLIQSYEKERDAILNFRGGVVKPDAPRSDVGNVRALNAAVHERLANPGM